MKLHVKIQREYDGLFTKMAKEAGVGLSDMAEIAIYNLIALYLKENEAKKDVPLAVSAVVVGGQHHVVGI